LKHDFASWLVDTLSRYRRLREKHEPGEHVIASGNAEVTGRGALSDAIALRAFETRMS